MAFYSEHRWASFQSGERTLGLKTPVLPVPPWRGESVPAGSTLLVLHEQDFGDALQFCRYLPMALDRFERVAYVCPAPLRRLFEHSLCARWPNLVLLEETPAGRSAWTHYCALMSLPMCLGTRLDTIPAPVPYLFADPRRTFDWPASASPRIGLVWVGGHTGTTAGARRSIAPEKLAAVLSCPGVQWISLQKAESDTKQLPPALAERIIDRMGEVSDFADTAALISTLDFVIAVDTSVAHLAAAMGKRVWLLNRFAGCRRWLCEHDDTCGILAFVSSQTARGDWDSVLENVRAELRAITRAPR